MAITDRPELSAAERRMPPAKYYDLPLYPPDPRESQLLAHMPIDPKLALPARNLLDLLQPTGYSKDEYGYCRMPDGSSYTAMSGLCP